jgi:uncharacterized protein YbcV (DUF1398 family)
VERILKAIEKKNARMNFDTVNMFVYTQDIKRKMIDEEKFLFVWVFYVELLILNTTVKLFDNLSNRKRSFYGVQNEENII